MLQRLLLGLIALLSLVAFVIPDRAMGSAAPATTAAVPDLDRVAATIVEQTNAFREEENRQAVKADDKLTAAAKYFADFMAETDNYGHEADGQTPAKRSADKGYEHCIVLENIAWQSNSAGFTEAELIQGYVQGWKDSPGHRKNMLDADVTQTGVAVARSAKSGKYYAVQMFGRPRTASITFKLRNAAGARVEYAVGDQTFTLGPRVTRTHEICRPEEVRVSLPGQKEPTVLKPADKDNYAVTAIQGQGYAVKKE